MNKIRRSCFALLLWLGVLSGCQNASQNSAAKDTMAPYINMRQYEFYTEVGQPLDFSNIGGYDDIDGMLPTRLKGYVDYSKPGEYYPSIVCTDLSGNQSEQVITIHVVESGELAESDPTPAPEPTPRTCEEGTDPTKPCAVVLSETIADYRILYEGEEGLEPCEAANGEDACEAIVRNDGSLWGYGAK